jgi:hypothetical protein
MSVALSRKPTAQSSMGSLISNPAKEEFMVSALSKAKHNISCVLLSLLSKIRAGRRMTSSGGVSKKLYN